MSTIEVNDLQIEYQVRGTGPALLFVAGTGYSGSTWWPDLIKDLAADHMVITYDHRGTGATTGEAGAFTTRDLAADALALLEGLGIRRAHVVGHSMGGRVAQWMALDGSERVSSLALMASGAGADSDSSDRPAGVPVATAAGVAEMGYREYVTAVQRRTFFTHEFAIREPQTVEWLAAAFWESRPALRDYFQHVAARQQHNTVGLLERIDRPALVVVGDRDTSLGGTGSHLEQSEYLASALPHAHLEVLPGVKHGFLWEIPGESASIIRRWVAGTP